MRKTLPVVQIGELTPTCPVLQDGGSPLMYASHGGHVQVVAELLQHGARVDMQNKV